MKEKLKAVVYWNGDTFYTLAGVLGITYASLSGRINGHVQFTLKELRVIKERYKLSAEDMERIFFAGGMETCN